MLTIYSWLVFKVQFFSRDLPLIPPLSLLPPPAWANFAIATLLNSFLCRCIINRIGGRSLLCSCFMQSGSNFALVSRSNTRAFLQKKKTKKKKTRGYGYAICLPATVKMLGTHFYIVDNWVCSLGTRLMVASVGSQVYRVCGSVCPIF